MARDDDVRMGEGQDRPDDGSIQIKHHPPASRHGRLDHPRPAQRIATSINLARPPTRPETTCLLTPHAAQLCPAPGNPRNITVEGFFVLVGEGFDFEKERNVIRPTSY